MAVINIELSDTFNQWRTKVNSLSDKLGDLDALSSRYTATEIIAALNEIKTDSGFDNYVSIDDEQADNTVDIRSTANNIYINPNSANTVPGVDQPAMDVADDMVIVKGDLSVGGTQGLDVLQGPVTINSGNLTVGFDASVGGNTTCGGTLYVDSTTTLNNTLSVAGSSTLNSLAVTNNATVGGTLTVTGNTTMNGTLTLAGGISLNGNVDIGNQTTDTLTILARVDSSVLPNADNTYNLGSSSLRWNELYATTSHTVATNAQYADLAENYLADQEYPVGTVIAVGGMYEVTAANDATGHSVIGVVSENPAYLMNSEQEGGTPIALKGRVQVRVEGMVKKGDRLAASSTPGVAIANNVQGNWQFAVALQDNLGDNGTVEAIIL